MSSSETLELTGDAPRARLLEGRAAALRERFERDFWSDRLGCYVLALQQGGRPLEVATSNAGQVLWSGIAAPDHARDGGVQPPGVAAAAMPYALASLLGLQPDALEHRLRIVDPRLPAGIDRLSLARVRVGRGVVDLTFLRSSDDNVGVSWQVREGPLVIEAVPPRGQAPGLRHAGCKAHVP